MAQALAADPSLEVRRVHTVEALTCGGTKRVATTVPGPDAAVDGIPIPLGAVYCRVGLLRKGWPGSWPLTPEDLWLNVLGVHRLEASYDGGLTWDQAPGVAMDAHGGDRPLRDGTIAQEDFLILALDQPTNPLRRVRSQFTTRDGVTFETDVTFDVV